jgi:hypothetical protein
MSFVVNIYHPVRGILSMKKIVFMVCLLSSSFLVGCEAVGPVLSKAVLAFGQSFLSQTSNNYAPEYAQSVNNLLLTVAEIATGQPFTQSLTASNDDEYATEYVDESVDYDSSDTDQDYVEPNDSYGSELALALDVALLAQTVVQSGESLLRPIQDGEVLYSAVEDPVRGDKIKLHFKPNCDCFLYIIGIDSTGWVTPMLPEPLQATIQLSANRSYLLPEGNEWWGLDEYQGVEHIYFVMTREQNLELEQALEALPQARPAPPPDYQPVVQPAMLSTRGMVKVQSDAPTAIPTQYGGNQMATAETFSADILTGDLVVTRWFQHQ